MKKLAPIPTRARNQIKQLTTQLMEARQYITSMEEQLPELRDEVSELLARVDVLEKRELTDHIDCNNCRTELLVTLRWTPSGVSHTVILMPRKYPERSARSAYTQEISR